jgi:hypothetical protein
MLALLLAPILSAQQTKVLPKGMDFVEGPSVLTPPFSTTTQGMQILFDASEVTTSVAVLTGMRFRPTQATQSSASFTKPYLVTAYHVSTTAAAFEALASPYDPNLVIAGAAPTQVFNGPLTLPATGPLAITPAPFSIYIPFTPAFVYDSSLGNLLLQIDTADLTPTPGTYRIDAVQFRFTPSSGIVSDIDGQGCVVAGNSLLSSTLDDNVIVGGSIDTTLTSSALGAFPAVIATLGFDRADTDLGVIGMSGCIARVAGNLIADLVLETPAGYPLLSRAIPPDPVFFGVPLVTQSLGLAASGLLGDSVVSNAEAMRICGSSLTITGMCGFRTVAGATDAWFHGTVGQITPVIQLEGVIP